MMELPRPALRRVAVTVNGRPKPQGSHSTIPIRNGGEIIGFRTTDDRKSRPGLKQWRADVKAAGEAAVAATGGWPGPLDGPLEMTVTFTMHRPALPRRVRYFGVLVERIHRPWQRPDLSKLLRSTEDALTDAGVWNDDAQLVRITAAKVYPGSQHDALPNPGAVITIWQLPVVRLPADVVDAPLGAEAEANECALPYPAAL